MKREDLEDAFKDGQISYSTISIGNVADFAPYVNISLKMDNKSLDYYYEIDVDELLESKLPIGHLKTMKELGWAFNDKKDKLIVYLQN